MLPEESSPPLGPPTRPADVPNGSAAKVKKAKKGKDSASKGVETLFRTSLSNHLKLSEMADRKASLMISINTILVSITISSFVKKYEVADNLLIPSLILLFVSLVTIVAAVLATNPITRSRQQTTRPDDRKTDLLFFGDYTKLSLADYRQRVQALIVNDDLLYNSLIDNVYAQGLVLARKYRLLKFAYTFFMIGFSTVILSYVVILLLAN